MGFPVALGHGLQYYSFCERRPLYAVPPVTCSHRRGPPRPPPNRAWRQMNRHGGMDCGQHRPGTDFDCAAPASTSATRNQRQIYQVPTRMARQRYQVERAPYRHINQTLTSRIFTRCVFIELRLRTVAIQTICPNHDIRLQRIGHR